MTRTHCDTSGPVHSIGYRVPDVGDTLQAIISATCDDSGVIRTSVTPGVHAWHTYPGQRTDGRLVYDKIMRGHRRLARVFEGISNVVYCDRPCRGGQRKREQSESLNENRWCSLRL